MSLQGRRSSTRLKGKRKYLCLEGRAAIGRRANDFPPAWQLRTTKHTIKPTHKHSRMTALYYWSKHNTSKIKALPNDRKSQITGPKKTGQISSRLELLTKFGRIISLILCNSKKLFKMTAKARKQEVTTGYLSSSRLMTDNVSYLANVAKKWFPFIGFSAYVTPY